MNGAARLPLLQGADAARALDIAERIAASPASLRERMAPESSDRYGGATLVVEALARAGRGDADALRSVLREALVLAPDRPGLHGGAGGLAIALDAVDPERAAFGKVRARIADALAASLREPGAADIAELRPYDLVGGRAGIAVALAAARGAPPRTFVPLARDLATALERALDSGDPPPVNLGVSHGVAGVLAALNLALPGEMSLSRRYVELLLRCSHGVRGARRWGPVWRAGEQPSARRAWCYQTVGVAAVIADRARIDRDAALYALAADALAAVLDDPQADDALHDAALCHGDAGVASIVWSFHEDTRLAGHAERLAGRVLDAAGRAQPTRAGFLDGALGIAIFLVDAATAQERRWLPLIGLLPDRLRPAAPPSPPA
jgi:lanthionine synthetase-like protein